MADVAITATDYFEAGANFHPQSSSATTLDDAANIMDEAGNVECETMTFSRTEFSTEFSYCNGTPDIATDLDTLLTEFGFVDATLEADDKIVTGLEISFTAGEYATVSISGVQYAENAITAISVADLSGVVPAAAGFGVPDISETIGSNATPSSLTLSFSANHVVARDEAGDHFVSDNITFRVEANAEYVGA